MHTPSLNPQLLLTFTAIIFGSLAPLALSDEPAQISPEAEEKPAPQGHYTIIDGEVNKLKSDSLTHWIRFDVQAQASLKKGSEEKPFKVINPIDLSKCSLSIDKPIKVSGKKVAAGVNLMKYRKFDGHSFNISMPSLHPHIINSIYLTEDFEFSPDTYTFKFQWQSADKKTLSDSLEVKIDLRAAEIKKQEEEAKKQEALKKEKAQKKPPLKKDSQQTPTH